MLAVGYEGIDRVAGKGAWFARAAVCAATGCSRAGRAARPSPPAFTSARKHFYILTLNRQRGYFKSYENRPREWFGFY